MKAILAVFVFACAMLAADGSGKWTGHVIIDHRDGKTENQPLIVVLKIDGKAVSGTAGSDESRQRPIVNSETRIDLVIKGDKATGRIATEGKPGWHKLELTRRTAP